MKIPYNLKNILIPIIILFLLLNVLLWLPLYNNIYLVFRQGLKYLIVVLCSLIVFSLSPKSGFNKFDISILKSSFIFILIADLFYVIIYHLKNSYIFVIAGFICYIVVHLLLLIRHTKRILSYYKKYMHNVMLVGSIIYSILITVIILYSIFTNIDIVNVCVIMYTLLITSSLFIAWIIQIKQIYPLFNSLCIAIGISLFFLSDMFVGYGHFFADKIGQAYIINLSWLFNIPGITLLALSGFKIENTIDS